MIPSVSSVAPYTTKPQKKEEEEEGGEGEGENAKYPTSKPTGRLNMELPLLVSLHPFLLLC